MTTRSLRWRFLLVGGGAIILILALSAAGLALLFDRHMQRVAVEDLKVRAMTLVAVAMPLTDDIPEAEPPEPPRDPLYRQPFSGHYWQMQLGDQVTRSRSLWDYELVLPDPPLEAGEWRIGTAPGPVGQTLLTVERLLLIGDSEDAVRLHVATASDRQELTRARAGFLRDLAPFVALLGVVLLVASFVQITIGLHPLARIGARVEGLGRGGRRRIGGDLPAEVMPLAEGLDRLLDDRDRELARARRRAGDLAHGFKTPLQALLGDAETLRERGQDDIAAEIEGVVTVMRRHVDRELTRARIQSDSTGAQSDPAEVAQRLIRVLQRVPQGAALDWRLEAPSGLCVRLDRDDLTEALGALMENAMRHAKTRVEITARRDGPAIMLSIRDDGPGVPEADLDRLMRRGVRLDQTSEGHGIGLAICAEIVEAAGGQLDLGNAHPGLRAEIRLPRGG